MNSILFDRLGRPRSGWRFASFLAVFILLTSLAVAGASAVISSAGFDMAKLGLFNAVATAGIALVLAAVLGWVWGKMFEGLPFKALGATFTKWWLRDLGAGLLLGALAVGVAVAAAAAAGNLGFSLNTAGSAAILRSAGISLVVFTVGAAFEEAFARGYIFQTFVRSRLAWLALILTSLIFASGHIGNPSAGTFSFVNTFLAGILLGAAYLKTRTLWFPFGIHLAWNFVLGSVFGIEVSGLTGLASAPLLQEIDRGPVWVTGGPYGLEGGAACTFALIIATAAIWFVPYISADEEMVRLSSPPEGEAESAEDAADSDSSPLESEIVS